MNQLLTKDELKDMPSRSDLEKALDKVEKSVERASRITHQLLCQTTQTSRVNR
jgi:hypothetical protein